MDEALVTLLRSSDDAASVAHDFIYGRNDVTQQQASDAIWLIHNALRPLFEDDPEPTDGPGETVTRLFTAARPEYRDYGYGYGTA